MDEADEILQRMQRKGVKLRSVDGGLRYEAPKGSVTETEVALLRAHKAAVVAILNRLPAQTRDVPLQPRPAAERIPLAFSQQWFWNQFELATRPSMRTVAAAVRLHGQLDLEVLKQSASYLLGRHEALRTRIASVDGDPQQLVDAANEYPLAVVDLTSMRACTREKEASRIGADLISQGYSVSEGPLFAVCLLKLAEREYELIVGLDHLIADGASLGILWRDLFSAYSKLRLGADPGLPTIGAQFADSSIWQHRMQRSWADSHSDYWRERLARAGRVRLVSGPLSSDAARWDVMPVRFGKSVSADLRELARRERTSLVMTVLATYVALVCRWCDITDLVVPFTTLGRVHPEVEHTIGFFGTPIFLRVELREEDTLRDSLAKVTAEYASAYAHDDMCRLPAQIPCPPYVWNPIFNWIPEELNMRPYGHIPDQSGEGGISVEPRHFPLKLRDGMHWEAEFRVDISDTKEGVSGTIGYRADRFSLREIQSFRDRFVEFAGRLANHPEVRVAQLPRVR
jgi:Condensation domain/TubC N-terminal docking domain